MGRVNQRYKLPRNWIAVPLILYSLVFFLAIGLISVSFAVFTEYSATLKARAETEKVAHYAELYDATQEESSDQLLAYFKSMNYDCIVFDNDKNIIRANSEVTLDFNNTDPDDEIQTVVIRTSFVKDDEKERNYTYYPDKSSKLIIVEADLIKPDINEILLHAPLEFYKKLENREVNYIPYWTAFKVRDGKEFIAFKSYHDISIYDVGYLSMNFVAAYILVILIFILLVSNIVRTHKNNRNMRKIVFRDNITGNRNWFWFALKSKELLKKRRGNTLYAIVSLTFVGYRNYVLCHSVDLGEKTLKNIWKIINGFLDKKEICAHSTISNFPILMKVTDEASAREKLERIIKSLETIGGNHDFKFQAGVYMIDPKIKKKADIDLLYNYASTARMTLEDNDDTGIAFFDQKLVEDTIWADKVTERQREAVENEEFKVYYQPKYDPRTNELMGAEALIRWVSEELGFVAPGRFIPIFENSGFITEIDNYMLSHVARDQKKWLDEGKKCVPVSVNVSRAHFAETNLAEQIRDIIDKEGAPRDLIEIELTESAFFDDKKAMLSTIKKLKEYGFLVSMDDFGSGYSSLNSLKDMPLDILKLDAGFFKSEEDNGRAEIVVSEALQLARKLNMTTVAEGVEEQAQVDFLATEGCNMIQGYYYAKPMPKEEYELRIGVPAAQVHPVQQAEPPKSQEPGIIMRLITESDAQAVSELIRKTISISNKKDYPEELMNQLIESETPEHVMERASWTHFYVAVLGGSIIGCGAIGPYWGKEDESSLFTIFVLPEYQGKGVGRFIINTLEKDEFFIRAKRIEIPASITGVPFYLKMGYDYKNGITEPDEEHLIRMEKFRK
ncbi:MAG: GNAT family N-acetyltransferase [Clostridiales bacterium]|nr:GNAT family N-acetyltransferase [Clostridiales bacterium]